MFHVKHLSAPRGFMSSVSPRAWPNPYGEGFDEDQAKHKAAHVGEPGHSLPMGEGDLHEEPYGEEQHSRYVYGCDEDENEYEGLHFGSREQQKIGPEDARDGSACPYHGDGGRR